jgi:hypothetical protein
MDPGEKALILPGRSPRIQMYERIGTQLPELAIETISDGPITICILEY